MSRAERASPRGKAWRIINNNFGGPKRHHKERRDALFARLESFTEGLPIGQGNLVFRQVKTLQDQAGNPLDARDRLETVLMAERAQAKIREFDATRFEVGCFFLFQFLSGRKGWTPDWSNLTYIYHLIERHSEAAALVEEMDQIFELGKHNELTGVVVWRENRARMLPYDNDKVIAAIETGQVQSLTDVIEQGEAFLAA